jgi:hypothetical protein
MGHDFYRVPHFIKSLIPVTIIIVTHDSALIRCHWEGMAFGLGTGKKPAEELDECEDIE